MARRKALIVATMFALALGGCGSNGASSQRSAESKIVGQTVLNACLEKEGWHTTESEAFNPEQDEPYGDSQAPKALMQASGFQAAELGEVEHTEQVPPPRATIFFYKTPKQASTIGPPTHVEGGTQELIKFKDNVVWLEWGIDNARIEQTIASCIELNAHEG
jgi:hypothetical protein